MLQSTARCGGDRLDQLALDVEAEGERLAGVGAHVAVGEVDEDRLVAGAQQHVGADAGAQRRGHRQQRPPPRLQRGQQVGRRRVPAWLCSCSIHGSQSAWYSAR